MLAACGKPRNETDYANDANSSTGIVHGLLIDRIRGREVERNGRKEKEQKADDVEGDGYRHGKGVGAV